MSKIKPPDQRAKDLLRSELGGGFGDVDYDWLITEGLSGYTHLYLSATVNRDLCSTQARGEVIKELAQCDLEKGTQLNKIVFECCALAPMKEIIEEVIANAFSMTEYDEPSGKMIAEILECKNENGINCLMNCFELLIHYANTGNDPKETAMKKAVEETIQFLLEIGRDNGVEMTRVINHTTEDGQTLIQQSTGLSLKVSSILMAMNVRTNTIDGTFQTVNFKVKRILYDNYLLLFICSTLQFEVI